MKLLDKLNKYIKLKRLFLTAAVFVVFVTTYSLILPAITMERKTYCGLEEHEHTEECYTVTRTCVCGQDEIEGHEHTDDCYTEEQVLVCELEENEEHTHTDECYETERILTCGKQEVEGHTHDDSCFAEERELTCGMEEHIHSDDCFVDPDAETEAPETEEPSDDDSSSNDRGIISGENETEYREDSSENETFESDEFETEETETGETETEETETAAEELAYPAVTLKEKIKDGLFSTWIEVTAEAQEGVLPEGTTLYIEQYMPEEDEQEKFDTVLSDTVKNGLLEYKAVRISFIGPDGMPVIPNGDVQLFVSDGIVEGAENLELVSIYDRRFDPAIENISDDDPEEYDPVAALIEIDPLLQENLEKNTVTYLRKPEEPEILAVCSTSSERTLEAEGKGYHITLTGGAKACIPQDAKLSVREIRENSRDYDGYVSDAEKQLDVNEGAVSYARFFDITIIDAKGWEIQPKEAVDVKIVLDDLQDNIDESAEAAPQVVHFGEEENETVEAEQTGDEVSFSAEGFSVYGVVYTVDFHWEVDGKIYQFSLPGGGFVSLTDLVEVLGITDDTNPAENGAETDAAEMQDSNGMLDVMASDAAKKFVTDVDSVEFSSPELVWVGKVENETTVDALKEANALACEYSAELTEEQIAEINAQTVEAGDWALISVQPFTSEETLTVTMKDGEVFAIRVTDAQIKKTVIDAKGDTWEITVTYDKDAQIPDGAELKVEEILPKEKAYLAYYQEAAGIALSEAESRDLTMPLVAGARMFDITIYAGDEKIEPTVPVQVSIRLDGAAADMLSVVHFGENGTQAMSLQETAPDDGDATEALMFETDSFSVYTVVGVNDLNLNNKYVLVSGIANDNREDGWTFDWGTDYFTKVVNAHAVLGEVNNNRLLSTGVHVWSENGTRYAGGGATEWGFEAVYGGGYRIYCTDSTERKYIHVEGENISLSTNQTQATTFTIENTNDGTGSVYIRAGNSYLKNDGNGAWDSRTYKMEGQNSTPGGSEYKFYLGYDNDQFDSFTAVKVSAKDLKQTDTFLIYRKILDERGDETLYALADDGTFVRVYDGGDSVYWRETDKNVYWHYQQKENGYDIYTTNAQGQTVYLSPLASGQRTFAETSPGLTLVGKDTEAYSTAIEYWDQASYDYAGLHVNTESMRLEAGTRNAGTSDEFLFAIAGSMPETEKEPVDTVDSASLGIKITMYDYVKPEGGNYNAGDKIPGMTAIAGSQEYTPHAAHALVAKYLVNGTPLSTTTNEDMTGLFPIQDDFMSTTNEELITYVKNNVNHLFLQSYYTESGTFRYRSEDNYAYLKRDGQTTDFTVYRQVGTPNINNTIGWAYLYHGHFMPFNDLDTSKNLTRLIDQYGTEELPVGDGRSYTEVYGVEGEPNFYTGMKMEATFTQPRNGRLENGDDMIFKFTGDDDMWVYIDGILVLDVGGIHEPLSGTINFATGKVYNPDGSSLPAETTLYQVFQGALNDPGTPEEVKEKIRAMKWKDADGDGTLDTFADYTNHDFKAFYMERGSGASNLDIQFNLKVTLTDEFTVEKKLPEGVDTRFVNDVYTYHATYKDNTGAERPLYAGIADVCSAVVYKDRTDTNGSPVTVAVDQNGYFTLKAGEVAVFKMADENIEYRVQEVNINNTLYPQVDINANDNVELTDDPDNEGHKIADSGWDTVADRSGTLFINHPETQNLLITKHITEDSLPVGKDENPVFEFRVYLETTETNKNGEDVHKLVPYSYGPYYLVKEVNGVLHYFTLDDPNNKPRDRGITPMNCSTTGRSGSINSIPPEYTIIIPDLMVGTNFYLEERRDNIPDGYEFIREELKEGAYDETNLFVAGSGESEADVINRVLARDETDHQEFDPETVGRIKEGVDAESHVYNRRPAEGLIITKKWEKNGVPIDFPDDYKIAWKLIRTTSGSEEVVYADSGTFRETENGIELDPSIDGNADRRLTKDNQTVRFDSLPMSGIVGGKKVTYTYRVEEDPAFSEKPAGSSYIFLPQIATVTAATGEDEGKLIYTLTNDMTSVDIQKSWNPTPNVYSVTVKLYRVEEDPTLKDPCIVTIKASFPERADKVIGPVTGTVGDKAFELSWNGAYWIGAVALEKNKNYVVTFDDPEAAQYYTATIDGRTITVGAEKTKTETFTGEVTGSEITTVTLNVTFTGNEDNVIPTNIYGNAGGRYFTLTKNGDTWSGTVVLPKGSTQNVIFDKIPVTNSDYIVTLENSSITVGDEDTDSHSFAGTVAKEDVGRRVIVNVTWTEGDYPGGYQNLFKDGWNNTNIVANVTTEGNTRTYVWKRVPTDENNMFVQIGFSGKSLKDYMVSVTGDGTSYSINGDSELLLTGIPSGEDDYTVYVTISPDNTPDTGTGSITIQNSSGDWIWVNPLYRNGVEKGTFGTTGNGQSSTVSSLPAGNYTVQLGYQAPNGIVAAQISGANSIDQWGDANNQNNPPNVNIHITLGDGEHRTITVNQRLYTASRPAMLAAKRALLSSTLQQDNTAEPVRTTVILGHETTELEINGTETYPDFTDETSATLLDTQVITADSGSEDGKSWFYKWSDLPAGNPETGMVYHYYVVEEIPTDTKKVDYGRTEDEDGTTVSIVNTPDERHYASFSVTKAVEGADTDREFTIRLKRTKDNETTWLHYTDTTPEGHNWGQESSATTWTFTASGSVTFTGLETGYTYTAVEDTGTGKVEVEGYNYLSDESTTEFSVDATEKIDYTGTITNKYSLITVDISILKVDNNDTEIKLGGATFELKKVQGIDTENEPVDEADRYHQTGTTSTEETAKGTLQFTGLTPGYYYLKETAPPEGYICTDQGWHFQVNADGIIGDIGDFDQSGKFRYVNTENVTVTNEPGTPLPHTGGPGTRIFTILGSILFLGAGVLLWRRRRLI